MEKSSETTVSSTNRDVHVITGSVRNTWGDGRRLRSTAVSGRVIEQMLYESTHHEQIMRRETTVGMPKDARCIFYGIRALPPYNTVDHFWPYEVYFVFEHESFAPVAADAFIPYQIVLVSLLLDDNGYESGASHDVTSA